jgi:hypothetical protein
MSRFCASVFISRLRKSLRKSLRRYRLLQYFIGGGVSVLLVGLLGSAAYNGLWDDDNRWINHQYGRQYAIHRFAIGIVTVSIFSFLAIIGAFSIELFLPLMKCLKYGLWASGFCLAIGAISVEGAARNYTYNGEHPIPSEIDYYRDQDFRDFYDTYTSPTWLPHTNLRGAGPPASVFGATFSDLDFSAF